MLKKLQAIKMEIRLNTAIVDPRRSFQRRSMEIVQFHARASQVKRVVQLTALI